MTRKRLLPLLLILVSLTTVPLFGEDELLPAADEVPQTQAPDANRAERDEERVPTAGEEIVRMWKAQVSADTILLFVKQNGGIVFTADDIAYMAESGIPDRFIRDLLKAAARARGDRYYPYYRYPAVYPHPPHWGGGIHIGGGHRGGGHGRGHSGGHGRH